MMAYNIRFFMLVMFIFVIVLALIGSLILLYRYLYKRQLNRKLNGEVSRFSLIEPFNFVLIILMFVIIVFSIADTRKLNELTDYTRNLEGQIYNLNSQIDSLYGRLNVITGQLEEMEEEARWIQDRGYKYVELTSDGEEVVTEVNFSFKEVYINQTIYLVITNKDDQQDAMKIEVEPENFNYLKSVNLKIGTDYQVEVVAESESTIKKEVLFDISLSVDLNNDNILETFGVGINEDGDEIINYAGIHYKHGGFEALQMETIHLITEIDGQATVIDITEDVKMFNSETFFEAKIIFDELEIHSFEIVIIDQMGNEYRSGKQSLEDPVG